MDHFNLEENGYNRSEVNNFLSDAIKQTEGIIEKCRIQTEEIEYNNRGQIKKLLIMYKV